MCWVSVLRRWATTPKSVQRRSPRWMTTGPSVGMRPARCTLTEGWNQVSIPRSTTFCRSHQTTSSVVVTPGVMTLLLNASEMMAWTVSMTLR